MSQLFSQHVSRVVCFGLKGFVTWQIVEQFVCQATSVAISSPGYSRFSDVSRGVVGFYRRITRVKSHKSLQPWRIFNEISWVLGISNKFVLQPLNQCNRGSRNLDMCSSNKWQSWKELNWKNILRRWRWKVSCLSDMTCNTSGACFLLLVHDKLDHWGVWTSQWNLKYHRSLQDETPDNAVTTTNINFRRNNAPINVKPEGGWGKA